MQEQAKMKFDIARGLLDCIVTASVQAKRRVKKGKKEGEIKRHKGVMRLVPDHTEVEMFMPQEDHVEISQLACKEIEFGQVTVEGVDAIVQFSVSSGTIDDNTKDTYLYLKKKKAKLSQVNKILFMKQEGKDLSG
ncbi:hypothetical protein WISP_60810 [Willisornis vidua]|uniref:Uncharacterized protein n=1 Tax=Willisornis vidua TaxID=1566151 RepID=A0ABQ9DAK6_9PASS|nr:hypothetical protein WISP_60810 [Willisornis vidua]